MKSRLSRSIDIPFEEEHDRFVAFSRLYYQKTIDVDMTNAQCVLKLGFLAFEFYFYSEDFLFAFVPVEFIL